VVILYVTTPCIVSGQDPLPPSPCNNTTPAHMIKHNIAACAGGFAGDIGGADASALCAAGWHVCGGGGSADAPAVSTV